MAKKKDTAMAIVIELIEEGDGHTSHCHEEAPCARCRAKALLKQAKKGGKP